MKHPTMSITSLNKLIPGLLPPKEEPEEPVDFLAILDNFDPAVLNESQLQAFAKSEPAISGWTDGSTYEFEGEVRPIPPQPIEWRTEHGKESLRLQRESLEKAEKRGTSYKERRSRLSKAIKTKSALYIAQVQERNMTASQKDTERRDWDRYYYDFHNLPKPLWEKPSETKASAPSEQEKSARETLLATAKEKRLQLQEIYDFLESHNTVREAIYKMISDPAFVEKVESFKVD